MGSRCATQPGPWQSRQRRLGSKYADFDALELELVLSLQATYFMRTPEPAVAFYLLIRAAESLPEWNTATPPRP